MQCDVNASLTLSRPREGVESPRKGFIAGEYTNQNSYDIVNSVKSVYSCNDLIIPLKTLYAIF